MPARMNQSRKRKRNDVQEGEGEHKACGECRRAHKKCDKRRPCSRCLQKGLLCKDYEKPTNTVVRDKKRQKTAPAPPPTYHQPASLSVTESLVDRGQFGILDHSGTAMKTVQQPTTQQHHAHHAQYPSNQAFRPTPQQQLGQVGFQQTTGNNPVLSPILNPAPEREVLPHTLGTFQHQFAFPQQQQSTQSFYHYHHSPRLGPYSTSAESEKKIKVLTQQVQELKRSNAQLRHKIQLDEMQNPFFSSYSTDVPVAMFAIQKPSQNDELIWCNESFAKLFKLKRQTLLKRQTAEVWKEIDIPHFKDMTPEVTQVLTDAFNLLKQLVHQKVIYSGRQKIQFGQSKFYETYFKIDQDVMYCRYQPIDRWDNQFFFNGEYHHATIQLTSEQARMTNDQTMLYAKSLIAFLRRVDQNFHAATD